MKQIGTVFSLFFLGVFLAGAARAEEDPALVLAHILASKGTISAGELGQIETAGDHQKLSLLASILKDKGVLDSGDLARLSLPVMPNRAEPVQGTPAAPAVQAAALTPATPSTEKSTSELSGIPVSTKKGIPLSVYGNLLLTTGYNTAIYQAIDTPMIASKQGTDPTGNDKSFFGSARQSRLGFNLDPINALGGKLSGTFEMDLMGGSAPYPNGVNNSFLRLRLAYGRVEWRHIAVEAGQEYSVFTPLNPTSLNEIGVPEMTATGNPWLRTPQLRLEAKTTRATGSNLLWQFAVTDPNVGDYPTTSIIVNRQPLIGERGRMPTLETRLAWLKTENEKKYSVGLSARYGRGKNAGTVGTVDLQTGVDSWGVGLDYVLPVTKWFNVSGEAYEGRALGIFNVALGESVGAVGTTGEHGVESRGGWVQAQFDLNKQLQMNLAYGLDVPNASQLPVGNRSRNQQYMANIIRKLTKNISTSIEYRRILTDYRNQIFANERGDHIDLGFSFAF